MSIEIKPLPCQKNILVQDNTDPRLPRKYGFVVYNGSRFSGKTINVSVIVKNHLIKQYKNVIIFTPNPDDSAWNAIKDRKNVFFFEDVSNDILLYILKEQKRVFIDSKGKEDLLLVIDDFNMERKHKKALDIYATKGRHSGITTIVLGQYFFHNSPTVRSNTTNWIIFRPLSSEIKKMCDSGLNLNMSPEDFETFIRLGTRNPYSFVHINFQNPERVFNVGFS